MADRIPVVTKTPGTGINGLAEMQSGETIGVVNGGTGATNAADARTNLGIVDNNLYENNGSITSARTVIVDAGTLTFKSTNGKTILIHTTGAVGRPTISTNGNNALVYFHRPDLGYTASMFSASSAAATTYHQYGVTPAERNLLSITAAGISLTFGAGKKLRFNGVGGIAGQVVTQSATGEPEWVNVGNTIYTGNGSIPGIRTVTFDAGSLIFSSTNNKTFRIESDGTNAINKLSVSGFETLIYNRSHGNAYNNGYLGIKEIDIVMGFRHSATENSTINISDAGVNISPYTGKALMLRGAAPTVGQVITGLADGGAEWATPAGTATNLYSGDGAIDSARIVTTDFALSLISNNEQIRVETTNPTTQVTHVLKTRPTNVELLAYSSTLSRTLTNVNVSDNRLTLAKRYGAAPGEVNQIIIEDAGIDIRLPATKTLEINGTAPSVGQVITGLADGGAEWTEAVTMNRVEWTKDLSISPRIQPNGTGLSFTTYLTCTPSKVMEAGTYRAHFDVMVSLNDTGRNLRVKVIHNGSQIGHEYAEEAKDSAGTYIAHGTNVGTNNIKNITIVGEFIHPGGVMPPFMVQARKEASSGSGAIYAHVWDMYTKVELIF
jgi:hypothetical protein